MRPDHRCQRIHRRTVGGTLGDRRRRARARVGTRRITHYAIRITQHTTRFEPAIGDVVDADAVRRAVDGCEVVIHCAAMQGGRAHLDDYRRVNVGGTSICCAPRAKRMSRDSFTSARSMFTGFRRRVTRTRIRRCPFAAISIPSAKRKANAPRGNSRAETESR